MRRLLVLWVLVAAAAAAVSCVPAGGPADGASNGLASPAVSPSGPAPASGSPVATASAVPSEPAPAGELFGTFRMVVPDGWRVYRFVQAHGPRFGGWFAQVSMVDMVDPCGTTDCDVTPYRLQPDTAVLWIGSGGETVRVDPVVSPPPGVETLTIDHLPAILEPVDPRPDTAAELALRWTIAMPNALNAWYFLTAELQGPDLAGLEHEIRTMVEGIRSDPPVVPLATDAAGVQAAAAGAVAQLTDRHDAYRCFPSTPGAVGSGVVDELPNVAPLDEPLAVNCSFEIEPTARQLWRLDLTFRFDADVDRLPGSHSYTVTRWFTGAGELLGSP